MTVDQPYKPQPFEMAHYDQAHAAASQTLDDLIQIHRDELADPGETREVCVVGLSVFLLGGSDAESLATLLALAVDRLAAENTEATCPRCAWVGLHNCGGEWRNHDRTNDLPEPS